MSKLTEQELLILELRSALSNIIDTRNKDHATLNGWLDYPLWYALDRQAANLLQKARSGGDEDKFPISSL